MYLLINSCTVIWRIFSVNKKTEFLLYFLWSLFNIEFQTMSSKLVSLMVFIFYSKVFLSFSLYLKKQLFFNLSKPKLLISLCILFPTIVTFFLSRERRIFLLSIMWLTWLVLISLFSLMYSSICYLQICTKDFNRRISAYSN